MKEYNWSTNTWSAIADTGVNTTSNHVWGNSVTSFSPVGPLGQELGPPSVSTIAAINIEDTSARMKGYLSSNGSLDTTVGIRYGTTSGSYSENATVGIRDPGFYNQDNGSLTSGDLYYFQAWAKNLEGFVNGSELTFFTEPPKTTNLAESASTNTTLSYTWTKPSVGSGATAYTRIQWDTTTNPTTISTGNNTYNSTGTSDSTTGLTPGTHYYFSAFSWAEESNTGRWNDTYDTMDAWTNPGDVTNPATTNGSTWVNITFTHGQNGEKTLIVRNSSGSGSYPTSRTDGDQIYNNTNEYFNDTGLSTSTTYYYALWTWDTDGNKWSDNQINITGTTTAAANNAPTQTGESPANTSTDICPIPALYVVCNDADAGDTLTATWRSNSSGSWTTFATNSSINPGTNITQTNSNFTNSGTTYY